jgi:branched-chain amino acid transport system substrate-binding protein
VNGERLALAHIGHRIGDLTIDYVSLDDDEPGSWVQGPGAAAANASAAAKDPSTIAYLGDFGSAETAISLPLTNAAGILQISPASPYIGLTSETDAGQDEPGRFYPTGRRTFARLQSGDPAQAQAQIHLMRSLHAHRVYVLDDQNPFRTPLAKLVTLDASRVGIDVAGHDSIPITAESQYSGEIEKILASHAQAVFIAAEAGAGAVALWEQLNRADPQLLLLGADVMTSARFTSKLSGAASSRTHLTTPVLATALYPRSAQRVLKVARKDYGGEVNAYLLYGYEAMTVVLDAIRRAGAQGNARQRVIELFFAEKHRNSVLGPYSIRADGETTLARYGADRIAGGRAVFDHSIDLGGG